MLTIKPKNFILQEDPGTLQKLSSVAVAAKLWRDEIANCGPHDRPLNMALPLLKSQSEIPPSVAKLVDKCIEPVRKYLYRWVKTTFIHIFLPYELEYNILRKYFDCISWRSDCSIDNVQTAKNLIACAKLHTMFKYKTACLYCLEDDVRRLYGKLSSMDRLDDMMWKVSPFMQYWECRIIHKNHNDTCSALVDTFDKLNPSNWTAWKYCWSRLPPKEQIDKAVEMIETKSDLQRYVKYLIPLLTKPQLVKVLKRSAHKIISVLARSPEDVKYALQTWHLMKNMITGDSFVKIFEDVFSSNLDVNMMHLSSIAECIVQHNTIRNIDESELQNVSVSRLLYDIWQHSPDHLKAHLIDKHSTGILAQLSKRDAYERGNFTRDVKLMKELLSRRSHFLNNTFWRKHWTNLIVGVGSSDLGEIMKLCFKNDKEIIKFKKTHMTVYSKIEPYCGELIADGYFNAVNEFLNFCTTDRNVKSGLKRNLIWNPAETMKFCTRHVDDPVKMRDFDEFVSDIYPDPERLKNFKCQMITSMANFKYLLKSVSSEILIPVKKLVCLFLTREADVAEVKKNFKKHCQGILNKGEFYNFHPDHWNEFLLWCLNDDQKQLDRFRESLRVDNIYNIVFPKCVSDVEAHLSQHTGLSSEDDESSEGSDDDDEWTDDDNDEVSDCDDDDSIDEESHQTDGDVDEDKDSDSNDEEFGKIIVTRDFYVDDAMQAFKKLQNFLQWYFANEAKVAEFKMDKLNKRYELPLSKLMTSKKERVISVVLYWFLDRDRERIESFKSELLASL